MLWIVVRTADDIAVGSAVVFMAKDVLKKKPCQYGT